MMAGLLWLMRWITLYLYIGAAAIRMLTSKAFVSLITRKNLSESGLRGVGDATEKLHQK
jgi:hypothetical protein